MDNMWDAIKRGLQDGAAEAINRAEELTQLARRRLDVAVVKTRLNRLQAELGVLAYGSIEAGKGNELSTSGDVLDLCDRIRAAQEDLTSCQTALQGLKDTFGDSAAPAENDPAEE